MKNIVHTKHRNPVKIKFSSVNIKFGNDDILLNSKPSINIVAKVDSFVPNEHNEERMLSISQFQKFFTDQIVTIKATIKRLSGMKNVSAGESLIKRILLWLTLLVQLELYSGETIVKKRLWKIIRTYFSISDTDQTISEIRLIRLKMVPAQMKSVTHSKKF